MEATMSESRCWVTFCWRRGMLKFMEWEALVMCPFSFAVCSARCARVNLDIEDMSLSVVFMVTVTLDCLGVWVSWVCFMLDGVVTGRWLFGAVLWVVRWRLSSDETVITGVGWLTDLFGVLVGSTDHWACHHQYLLLLHQNLGLHPEWLEENDQWLHLS